MGPGRDDGVEHDLSAGGATSRVELGDRSHPAEEPEPDVAAAAGESSQHWLAGLVRADVLAVTGVGVVLLSMIGLPFLSMMERLTLYIGPMGPFDLSTAWAFAPPLVAGGVAMLLGLAALRQVGRHGAAGWVRTVAGVAALLGLLIAAGSAVTWLYAADSGVFDQEPQF